MTLQTNFLNICNPMNPCGWSRNYTEYTQLFPWCLSPAASSDAFVMPFLECLLEKTLFSLFTLFKPDIWMCQKTELLSGANIQ